MLMRDNEEHKKPVYDPGDGQGSVEAEEFCTPEMFGQHGGSDNEEPCGSGDGGKADDPGECFFGEKGK